MSLSTSKIRVYTIVYNIIGWLLAGCSFTVFVLLTKHANSLRSSTFTGHSLRLFANFCQVLSDLSIDPLHERGSSFARSGQTNLTKVDKIYKSDKIDGAWPSTTKVTKMTNRSCFCQIWQTIFNFLYTNNILADIVRRGCRQPSWVTRNSYSISNCYYHLWNWN